MRNYLAKVELKNEHKNMSSGAIAEHVFENWFINNFEGEILQNRKQIAILKV